MARTSGCFEEGHANEKGTSNRSRGRIEGFGSQEGHKIRGQVAVASVSIGSDPGDDSTYEKGDAIEILVEFEDEVTVTGAPQLELDLGEQTKEADFKTARSGGSESGESTSGDSGNVETTGKGMAFSYTVQEGDEDTDGITVNRNSLNLNGGSIVDAAGNAANLDYEEVSAEGHQVGAVPLTFVSAATSTDGTEVTITFNEDVNVSSQLRTLSSFAGVDVGVYLQVLVVVFADSHRMHTSAAEVPDTKLTLTLTRP